MKAAYPQWKQMATRIADLSRRRGTGRLVGRDGQLAALTALLEPDPPALIAFVHGIAGIHSLREKLGAHADAVETVRSVGYRLREGWTTEPA
jgi:hypothetical protein